MRNGLGTFYYANGSTYEGTWVNNKKQGYAVYTDENGEVSHCFFQNDRLMRKIHVSDSLLQCLTDDSKLRSKYTHYKSTREIVKQTEESSSKSKPLHSPSEKQQSVPVAENGTRRGERSNIINRNGGPNISSGNNHNNSSLISQTKNLDVQLRPSESPVKSENPSPNQPSTPPLILAPSISAIPDKNPNPKPQIDGVQRTTMNPIPLSTIHEAGMEGEAENPYLQLIDLQDIVSEDQMGRVMHQLCEVMLRYHSQMKQWYTICAAESTQEYEEGFFMDLGGLTKFIYDNRLLNGKANLPNFCRLLARYGGKEFELYFEQSKVEVEVELMKKYDFESTEIENELSRFDDKSYVEKKIEGLLLEDFNHQKKRRLQQYSPQKVLLFRSFVNSLVRLVYLKTGSIFKLASHVDRIFSKRIAPLMEGEIKPKKIVSEEHSIISKSKAVLEKYLENLEMIYSIGRARSFKFSDGDMIDFKTILIVLKEFGLLKYDTLEDQLNTWMVLERGHDPEESVFRLVSKLIQKGRPDERIDQRIKMVMLPKLHCEVNFEEFCETFVLFVCKNKEVSPKLTIFANKLNNTLKGLLEQTEKVVKTVSTRSKPVRNWPKTQKDHE